LITSALSRLKLNIKLDYFRIKEDVGTADSLRLIYEKIKVNILYFTATAETNHYVFLQTDILVVSCDLITDIPLHNLFELHRIHQSCITSMFSQIHPQEVSVSRGPGPKSKSIQSIHP